ncbi:MAG: WD40/YVTN/BNR-like repeat-containing protein, partial [Gemmatimonadales bacterium]
MRPTIRRATSLAIALFAFPLSAQTPPAQRASYDPSLFSGLRYRLIGPSRGGRVTTVTGVPSQPYTFYFGSAGGGIWKTTDAGHNWLNVSDGQIAVGSMGAIDVSLSDPNVVYAGTGSSKIRSNVSIGRGIYKST